MNVKDLLRRSQNDEKPDKLFQSWTNTANDLQRKFNDAKASVHLALCDNIDTRTVLDVIRNLIGLCNVYIHDASDTLNHLLLKRIAVYVTKILRIFGVIHDARDDIGFPLDAGKSTDVSFSLYQYILIVFNLYLFLLFIYFFPFHFGISKIEETVMPYLTVLAEFRKDVRDMVRAQKPAMEILTKCDAIRDDVLPNLGVRLEDRDAGAFSIKLMDREMLMRERDAKKQAEAQKQALKEKKRQEAAAAAAALDAQRKINPKEMFLNETDKYSAFDDRVSVLILS